MLSLLYEDYKSLIYYDSFVTQKKKRTQKVKLRCDFAHCKVGVFLDLELWFEFSLSS